MEDISSFIQKLFYSFFNLLPNGICLMNSFHCISIWTGTDCLIVYSFWPIINCYAFNKFFPCGLEVQKIFGLFIKLLWIMFSWVKQLLILFPIASKLPIRLQYFNHIFIMFYQWFCLFFQRLRKLLIENFN